MDSMCCMDSRVPMKVLSCCHQVVVCSIFIVRVVIFYPSSIIQPSSKKKPNSVWKKKKICANLGQHSGLLYLKKRAE